MKNKLIWLIVSLLVIVCAFLTVILFISPDVKEKEKVNVYVFVANGCPFCEEQLKYLIELDTYSEEFEIVTKELNIDNINWEPGKDYDLGMKVGKLFHADIDGTPFVVVSNIYGKVGFNNDLRDTISRAYNLGHTDVVSCVEHGYEHCMESKYLPVKENKYLPVRIIEIITILFGLVFLVLFIRLLRKGK